MLFIRSGWKEAYDSKSDEDRSKAALRHGSGKDGEDGQRYAGVSQEQKILDWLHDSYFASVAGDAPAFEAWPTHESTFPQIYVQHQTDVARLPPPRVHPRPLGNAARRDAGSRKACANLPREEQMVLLLHLCAC